MHKGKPEGRVVYPTGFIFHESRVGSTLVANMLASNPWAMVSHQLGFVFTDVLGLF